MKVIPTKCHRAGLYVRLQNVSVTSPVLLSTTQYGTEKRTFTDDFVFKVSKVKFMDKNNI